MNNKLDESILDKLNKECHYRTNDYHAEWTPNDINPKKNNGKIRNYCYGKFYNYIDITKLCDACEATIGMYYSDINKRLESLHKRIDSNISGVIADIKATKIQCEETEKKLKIIIEKLNVQIT